MGLSKQEKVWVDTAYVKLEGDLNKFVTFLEQNVPERKELHGELIIHFNSLKGLEVTKKDENEFKSKIDDYLEVERQEGSGLGSLGNRKKYKEEIRWVKNARKFLKQYKKIIEKILEDKEKLKRKYGKILEKENEEINLLKRALVESIINAEGILDIPGNYEELLSLNVDELTNLIRENVEDLDNYLNRGRV